MFLHILCFCLYVKLVQVKQAAKVTWLKVSDQCVISHLHWCQTAAYRLYTVVPRLVKFVDELTNWYVRMNRRRLKGETDITDCHNALATLFSVLFTMTKVMVRKTYSSILIALFDRMSCLLHLYLVYGDFRLICFIFIMAWYDLSCVESAIKHQPVESRLFLVEMHAVAFDALIPTEKYALVFKWTTWKEDL